MHELLARCVLKTVQRENRFTLNGHMGPCMFGLTVFYYFIYQRTYKEQCSQTVGKIYSSLYFTDICSRLSRKDKLNKPKATDELQLAPGKVNDTDWPIHDV